MIKLNVQSSQRLPWKRRQARGSTRKKLLLDKIVSGIIENEDANYSFQAKRLSDNFQELLNDRKKFPERKYIRVILLPEEGEIEDPLKEYFLERYSLELATIEPFGVHSLAFFEPLEWGTFIDTLQKDITEFIKFADHEISYNDFSNRRITLIHEFSLLVPAKFDLVIRPNKPEKQISLSISQVKPNTVSDEFIRTCAQAAGLKVNINDEGLLKEADITEQFDNGLVTPRSLDQFIKNLDKSLDIKAIHLDKMMIVDQVEFDLKIRTNLPQIENPIPESPIVCIIDSGVESNHYTEKSLLSGEGKNDRGLSLDPKNTDPQSDSHGHGTSVASYILFGTTLKTNIIPNRRTLLPVAKIYPVKLMGYAEKDLFHLGVRELFKTDSDLAEAIKRHGIKIINLSLNSVSGKLFFPDRSMSEEAVLIDRFSKKLKVIVVVSTGNIKSDELTELIKNDGKNLLEKIDENSDRQGKYLKILPPADLLSGIATGSCWTENEEKFVPSWFTRCLPPIKNKAPIKPDCLALGGDYALKINSNPPIVERAPAKSIITTHSYGHLGSDDYLFFEAGTSFAAPQVARTLAIAQASYPNASVESIKGLFLHRASAWKTNNRKLTDDSPPVLVNMIPAFGGAGVLADKDELNFLTGKTGSKKGEERTYAIEGSLGHEEMIYFDLPLDDIDKMMKGLDDHKLGMRISVSYLPSPPSEYRSESLLFRDANQIHIAACLHSPEILPLQTEGKNINQPITMTGPEWINNGLVEWTMDYYGVIQTPFATREKNISWKTFREKIGERKTVRLSVRCFIKDENQRGTSQDFAVIVTFKDLGAHLETRARSKIDVKV